MSRLIMLAVNVSICCAIASNCLSNEFRFCVFSENSAGAARIIGDIDRAVARDLAESRFCEMNCAELCAALDFNERQCGKNGEFIYEPNRRQSHYYCETPDGHSLPKRGFYVSIRAVISPSYSGGISSALSIIRDSNDLLARNGCPLTLKLDSNVRELPEAFGNLRVRDEKSLRDTAKYPGTIKFVSDISYCGSNPTTIMLDNDGRERFAECAPIEYASFLIANASTSVGGILLLRGFAHLSSIEANRDISYAYTLADPDLLIPESPLLSGNTDAFKITRYQCLRLAKYALESNASIIWKSETPASAGSE